jgi:hypothetical protein
MTASATAERADLEQAYLLACERFRRSNPSLLDWSEAFRVEEGEPLDFDAFPFQREIYAVFDDRGIKTVDVMKSGQCGISAAAVSLTLFVGEMWDRNVLYVLPGAQDAYDFSDSRVKPAIEGSPYLTMRFGGETANKGLRRIGHATLYFRGSVSEKKALSIPADVLVLDEYDRLDQRNVPKFRKRLGSPKSLKLERRFSNPSLPEMGIHALYLETDQREWHVTCACDFEASIHYEAADEVHYVDEERMLRVCGRCHAPLPRAAIAGGRWVATKPRVKRLGYHISKLVVPDQEIDELVTEHHSTDEETLQAHYNFDLGLPYAPKGGSLSQETVLACRRNYQPPDSYHGTNWVTAGIDVGRVLHVRISRWLEGARAAPLYIGEVQTFDDLDDLMERFSIGLAAIDSQPEEKSARDFAGRHTGRVVLVRWAGEGQAETLKFDEDERLLRPRRTWACDQTVAGFRSQLKLLPKILHPRYLLQVTAPYRIMEQTMAGQKVARYISQRADHFFFAECYDLMARLFKPVTEVADVSGPAPQGLGRRRLT